MRDHSTSSAPEIHAATKEPGFSPLSSDRTHVALAFAPWRHKVGSVVSMREATLPPALPHERERQQRAFTRYIVVNAFFALTAFFALIFAVPVFAAMFADFDARLPGPTQFLIDLSYFVKSWGWIAAWPIAGVVAGLLYLIEQHAGRPAAIRSLRVLLIVQLGLLALALAALFLPVSELSTVASG